MMSVETPGPWVTMMRTGFTGYWACAIGQIAQASAARIALIKLRFNMV